MTKHLRATLAPTGRLRAGINLGNILLVTGEGPSGVSPDMARFIAERLEVEVELIPVPSPGEVADRLGRGEVDIGLIAREAERARTIAFTAPYVGIEATYLVPPGSAVTNIEDVDRPGMRIAVSNRSAYDLYLSRTLLHAELVRGDGLAGTFAMFRDDGLDVLAGLRPALMDNAADMPGARVLDGAYMTVEQAVGMAHGHADAHAFLEDCVAEARRTGLTARSIDRHGVTGRLSIPD